MASSLIILAVTNIIYRCFLANQRLIKIDMVDKLTIFLFLPQIAKFPGITNKVIHHFFKYQFEILHDKTLADRVFVVLACIESEEVVKESPKVAEVIPVVFALHIPHTAFADTGIEITLNLTRGFQRVHHLT